MAFCPNCGTPNTDQAEKCVACGYELSSPKQKAKFKGTIMMSGIKAPAAPEAQPAPAAQPPAPPSPAPPEPKTPSAPSADAGRNSSLQKTMLGHAPLRAPGPSGSSSSPSASAPEPGPRAPADLGRAPTMQGPAPHFTPTQPPAPRSLEPGPREPSPPRTTAASAPGGGFGTSDTSGGFSTSGGWSQTGTPSYPTLGGGAPVDSTFPPPANKPGPGKILAIGCGAVLLLSCLIGGILYFVLADKLKALLAEGGDSGAEAVAWQASIGQALAQVSALCQVDCAQAGVFFHPQVQGALLGEAKALTPARVQKLSDPQHAKAAMLDATEDRAVATGLGLDPQQCARVLVGSAKVVSCSVPDPGGKPSVLRIVHMSGITSL